MELRRGRKMGRVEELLAHGRVGWALRWWIHRGGGEPGRGGAGLEQGVRGEWERRWLGRVFWTRQQTGWVTIRARANTIY